MGFRFPLVIGGATSGIVEGPSVTEVRADGELTGDLSAPKSVKENAVTVSQTLFSLSPAISRFRSAACHINLPRYPRRLNSLIPRALTDPSPLSLSDAPGNSVVS